MWANPQFPADLVIYTEEILNGKLHFLCSVYVTGTHCGITSINIDLHILWLLNWCHLDQGRCRKYRGWHIFNFCTRYIFFLWSCLEETCHISKWLWDQHLWKLIIGKIFLIIASVNTCCKVKPIEFVDLQARSNI